MSETSGDGQDRRAAAGREGTSVMLFGEATREVVLADGVVASEEREYLKLLELLTR